MPSPFDNGNKTDPAGEGSDTSGENLGQLLKEQGGSSKRLATLLDECFRIPGTKIRFGLDPILGLIPGGGEAVATIIGAYIVGDATRKGIPFRMVFKMTGNMLLNAMVGAIPGAGDAFSVWFKSNSRNYQLMREHLETSEGVKSRGGWWPLILVAVMIGFVLLVYIFLWLLLWKATLEIFNRIV